MWEMLYMDTSEFRQKDQNPDRQIYALKEHGTNEDNIFVDRLSGKNFIRPEYKRMTKKLRG